jgi:hypothetical protein
MLLDSRAASKVQEFIGNIIRNQPCDSHEDLLVTCEQQEVSSRSRDSHICKQSYILYVHDLCLCCIVLGHICSALCHSGSCCHRYEGTMVTYMKQLHVLLPAVPTSVISPNSTCTFRATSSPVGCAGRPKSPRRARYWRCLQSILYVNLYHQ